MGDLRRHRFGRLAKHVRRPRIGPFRLGQLLGILRREHRMAHFQSPRRFAHHPLAKTRLDRPRFHERHRNARRLQFHPQAVADRFQRELAGRVRPQERHHDAPDHRTDQHDPPALLRAQDRNEAVREIQRPDHVRFELFPDRRPRQILQRARLAIARVVDDGADHPLRQFQHFLRRVFDRIRIRQIQFHRLEPFAPQQVQIRPAARRRKHPPAAAFQQPRRRAADARRRARHHRHLVRHGWISFHAPILCGAPAPRNPDLAARGADRAENRRARKKGLNPAAVVAYSPPTFPGD